MLIVCMRVVVVAVLSSCHRLSNQKISLQYRPYYDGIDERNSLFIAYGHMGLWLLRQ